MVLKIETKLLSEELDLINFSILSLIKMLNCNDRKVEQVVLARTLKISKKTIQRRIKDLIEKDYIIKSYFDGYLLCPKAFELLSFEVKKDNEKRELEKIKEREKTPIQKLFDSVCDNLRR